MYADVSVLSLLMMMMCWWFFMCIPYIFHYILNTFSRSQIISILILSSTEWYIRMYLNTLNERSVSLNILTMQKTSKNYFDFLLWWHDTKRITELTHLSYYTLFCGVLAGTHKQHWYLVLVSIVSKERTFLRKKR